MYKFQVQVEEHVGSGARHICLDLVKLFRQLPGSLQPTHYSEHDGGKHLPLTESVFQAVSERAKNPALLTFFYFPKKYWMFAAVDDSTCTRSIMIGVRDQETAQELLESLITPETIYAYAAHEAEIDIKRNIANEHNSKLISDAYMFLPTPSVRNMAQALYWKTVISSEMACLCGLNFQDISTCAHNYQLIKQGGASFHYLTLFQDADLWEPALQTYWEMLERNRTIINPRLLVGIYEKALQDGEIDDQGLKERAVRLLEENVRAMK